MNVERNAKIMKLVAEGYAYSAIAERMGMTRNAVSGVVFRHKHPDVKTSQAPRENAA